MDSASVLAAVEVLKQKVTSCLTAHNVAFCSYVWPGCEPPKVCDKNVQVSFVYTPDGSYADNCTITEFLEIDIFVDQCLGAPETAAEADAVSIASHPILIDVHNGLMGYFAFLRDEDACQKARLIHGFKCRPNSGPNDEKVCARFVAKVRLST